MQATLAIAGMLLVGKGGGATPSLSNIAKGSTLSASSNMLYNVASQWAMSGEIDYRDVIASGIVGGVTGSTTPNTATNVKKPVQNRGSSLPVPEPVRVNFQNSVVTYQSNPKHTLGYGGSRPGHLASLEPSNSLNLFKNSVSSKNGTRIAYDRNTNTVHQFFSDSSGSIYHWSGTLDRNRIDKLSISVRRQLGIPGK